jgi:SepF-like predicted cell division protein (DUF552 family)
MIERVSKSIEVFSLNEKTDLESAVDAIIDGKIVLMKVGSVFSFVFNPNIANLMDKTDREVTERYLKNLFSEANMQTPLVYDLP